MGPAMSCSLHTQYCSLLFRSSRHDRDGTSAREPQQSDRSRGRHHDSRSHRDSGHDRSHRYGVVLHTETTLQYRDLCAVYIILM